MAEACLTFRDFTLGYNSHPAVHHLSGVVEKGLADGGGRRQRVRQVDADEGIVGVLKPMAGAPAPVARHARRLSAAAVGTRPQSFPARGRRPRLDGPRSRGAACSAGYPAEDRKALDEASAWPSASRVSRSVRSTRCRGGQLQRALFARVLVQDAELILLDEPVQRRRRQDASATWWR